MSGSSDSDASCVESRLRAPIERLPPKLLFKIFLYDVWADHLQSDHSKGCENLKAIHLVCSHWHQIAAACPSLWSQSIRFERDSPKRTQQLLDRSHPASLNVEAKLGIHDKLHPAGLNVMLALEHLPRIWVFSLWMPEIHLAKILPRMNRPAPSLHALSLRNEDHQRTCDLPELFARQTPELRSLDIGNCSFSWDFPLPSKLVHLTIRNFPSAARSSWSQLFSVLETLPVLQTLSLDFVTPQYPSHTVKHKLGDHSVSLPHLSHFHLADDIAACTYFTSCLTFPSTSTLSLRCENIISGIDASDILAWIGAKLAVMTEEKMLQDVCIHSEGFHFGILGWLNGQNKEDAFPVPLGKPNIETHFYFPGKDDHHISSLIAVACDVFPLNHVKRLNIPTEAIHVPRMAWPTVLKNFTAVHTLELGDPPYGLFDALEEPCLADKSTTETSSGVVQILLPSLRVISLGYPSFALEDLLPYLKFRKTQNAEIKKFLLQDCDDLTPEDIDQLRGLVTTVEWAGVDSCGDNYDDDDDVMA